MASQTVADDGDDEQRESYVQGWAEIGAAMQQGRSWSGHERNVAFLNTGEGLFVDASWVAGLDHEDDGRAVAEVDWDGDGDLDLWFRNRSGPALRLMLNRSTPERRLSLILEGRESNRDAVGASVLLTSTNRKLRRDVVAGDGYLSQSSRRLHFGLAADERVQRLDVRWPGGATESFEDVTVGRDYKLVQGSGALQPLAIPARAIEPSPIALPEPPALSAIVLKEPLPLPPGFLSETSWTPVAGLSRLVVFWAHWCQPCLEELSDLSASYPAIKSAGVDIVPLNVDEPQARAEAEEAYRRYVLDRAPTSPFRTQAATRDQRELIETLVADITATDEELRIPTGLLIDPLGRLQVIYLGPVGERRLLRDHRRLIVSRPDPAARGLFPGRWYFRTPRPYGTLAGKLKKAGLNAAARYYLGLDRVRGPAQGGENRGNR